MPQPAVPEPASGWVSPETWALGTGLRQDPRRGPLTTGLGSTGEGAGGGRRTSQGAAGENQGAWGCAWGGVASIVWNSAWTCPQAWPEKINSDCPHPTPQRQTKQEKTQHSFTHRCGN